MRILLSNFFFCTTIIQFIQLSGLSIMIVTGSYSVCIIQGNINKKRNTSLVGYLELKSGPGLPQAIFFV